VVELHRTLDVIVNETLPAAKQSQRTDDRRVVARGRRKEIERRAAELLPNSEIDPSDTGEFVVPQTRTA
jgi:hypothetical protein